MKYCGLDDQITVDGKVKYKCHHCKKLFDSPGRQEYGKKANKDGWYRIYFKHPGGEICYVSKGIGMTDALMLMKTDRYPPKSWEELPV